MLEAAGGAGWEELIRREVFEHLQLGPTGFGPPGTRGQTDQPRGHLEGWFGLRSYEPGPLADNPRVLGPAATVHITLCELLRYAIAHAEMPADYLPPEAWATLHAPRGDGYALGWFAEGGRLAHFGSNTLWFAGIAVWPGAGRAAVVTTNDGRIEVIEGPVGATLDAMAP